VDVLYLAFSKAFDTVSQNVLVDKLKKVWARKMDSEVVSRLSE